MEAWLKNKKKDIEITRVLSGPKLVASPPSQAFFKAIETKRAVAAQRRKSQGDANSAKQEDRPATSDGNSDYLRYPYLNHPFDRVHLMLQTVKTEPEAWKRLSTEVASARWRRSSLETDDFIKRNASEATLGEYKMMRDKTALSLKGQERDEHIQQVLLRKKVLMKQKMQRILKMRGRHAELKWLRMRREWQRRLLVHAQHALFARTIQRKLRRYHHELAVVKAMAKIRGWITRYRARSLRHALFRLAPIFRRVLARFRARKKARMQMWAGTLLFKFVVEKSLPHHFKNYMALYSAQPWLWRIRQSVSRVKLLQQRFRQYLEIQQCREQALLRWAKRLWKDLLDTRGVPGQPMPLVKSRGFSDASGSTIDTFFRGSDAPASPSNSKRGKKKLPPIRTKKSTKKRKPKSPSKKSRSRRRRHASRVAFSSSTSSLEGQLTEMAEPSDSRRSSLQSLARDSMADSVLPPVQEQTTLPDELLKEIVQSELGRVRSLQRARIKVVDGRIYHMKARAKDAKGQGPAPRAKRKKLAWEYTGCLHDVYTEDMKERLRAALFHHGKGRGYLRQKSRRVAPSSMAAPTSRSALPPLPCSI